MKSVHRVPPVFARYLRRHRALHRFRRLAWWGHPVGSEAHRAARSRVDGTLRQAAGDPVDAVLARWHSRREGLSPAQAQSRRRRHGPNVVGSERPASAAWLLWQAYRNPFSLLLTGLAGVSGLTGDLRSAAVIGAIVALATGMRFVQERRSQQAADALKALVHNHARVRRPGEVAQERPMAELVPGDVVELSAGDMIPADARLLDAKDLFVNQAAMTGEALPVEKAAGAGHAGDALEQPNLVFMGSNVVSGSATALVLATGEQTFFGELARHAGTDHRPPTQFQAGINRVSWMLIRIMAVMVPAVLLINGYGKGDWLEALLFAVSVAVGLTPEMLPMIVTSTLAKGAVALSRRRVIVKRLDAIQNLGAMDVLCTDKTGTLTQDRIALQRHVDAQGRDDDEVLRWVRLNSHFQTGLRNLLDEAVLVRPEWQDEPSKWRLRDEIPFDFQRRRLSVLVAPAEGDGPPRLVCKGAVEEMLAVCTELRCAEGRAPLDEARRREALAVAEALNADGLRVVAVALRDMAEGQTAVSVADESRMCLWGFVAFLDPPKDSAAAALAALAARGITVKVLTGDNVRVAVKVCRDVGLEVGDSVLTGTEIEGLDDAGLQQAAATHTLFAKLAPAHKERVVAALRAQGHVVGFMGDGINDAPALHAADVGISVDSAVDIAKEVADLVLLEKSLAVLADGVEEGRRTFANMVKYIRLAASSNFGNVLSVLIASLVLPFLPMLPMHLLVQNLLYDLSQLPIPFDTVDDELIARPLQWNPASLMRFMLCFGPLSSLFDLLTFALLAGVFQARTPAMQTLFQSGWFIEGLVTQVLVVHVIRTPRRPFVDSRAAPALGAMGLAVVALAIALPQGPWSHWLRMQALPGAYFLGLAGVLAGYLLLAQALKRWWLQRWPWL